MAGKISNIPVSISPSVFLIFAFAVLAIPIQLMLSWLFAALVHELCHYWALRICKRAVYSVVICVGGAKISTEPLTELQEVFCSLAGPVGGMLLLPFASGAPAVAICALLQSVYNLLPIYPMDGGRALLCLMRKLFKHSIADRVMCILSQGIIVFLVLVCITATFYWNLGVLPLAAGIILAVRNKKSLANGEGREYNVFSYGFKRKLKKLTNEGFPQ